MALDWNSIAVACVQDFVPQNEGGTTVDAAADDR